MRHLRRKKPPEFAGHDDLGRRTARAEWAKRALIVVGCLTGGAVLFLLSAGMVLLLQLAGDSNRIVATVEDRQGQNAPILESIQDLALEIRSCTDPEGDCAQRGAQRQAEALLEIRKDTRNIVAATVACQSQGIVEFSALTACVDRFLLTKAARQDPASPPQR